VNLRPRNPDQPELNLTPLIDVVFLLVIFFMVSTTFEKESVIKIELPEASTEAPQAQEESIELVIDTDGHYFVNQHRVLGVELANLRRAIEEIAGDRRDLPFLIRADGQTPHQAVVTAMDAAGQLGFTHLTFATRRTDSAR